MGRKSTKENKTIYQRYREQNDLTREKAAELLDTVSEDRIERIENEKLLPDPEDVIRMAECYKAPDLCNFYCSHQCPIGEKVRPCRGDERAAEHHSGDRGQPKRHVSADQPPH